VKPVIFALCLFKPYGSTRIAEYAPRRVEHVFPVITCTNGERWRENFVTANTGIALSLNILTAGRNKEGHGVGHLPEVMPNWYPPYMSGGGYMLSCDLVHVVGTPLVRFSLHAR
jgi:hypothetical protein